MLFFFPILLFLGGVTFQCVMSSSLLTESKPNSITVSGLASDGVAPTPTPVPPTPTPVPEPPSAPLPVRPPTSIEGLIAQYPWPYEQALRIARCESELKPFAVNGVHIGIYQINYLLHGWRLYSGESLYDAGPNIRVAYDIWASDGGSWRQWSCQ